MWCVGRNYIQNLYLACPKLYLTNYIFKIILAPLYLMCGKKLYSKIIFAHVHSYIWCGGRNYISKLYLMCPKLYFTCSELYLPCGKKLYSKIIFDLSKIIFSKLYFTQLYFTCSELYLPWGKKLYSKIIFDLFKIIFTKLYFTQLYFTCSELYLSCGNKLYSKIIFDLFKIIFKNIKANIIIQQNYIWHKYTHPGGIFVRNVAGGPRYSA